MDKLNKFKQIKNLNISCIVQFIIYILLLIISYSIFVTNATKSYYYNGSYQNNPYFEGVGTSSVFVLFSISLIVTYYIQQIILCALTISASSNTFSGKSTGLLVCGILGFFFTFIINCILCSFIKYEINFAKNNQQNQLVNNMNNNYPYNNQQINTNNNHFNSQPGFVVSNNNQNLQHPNNFNNNSNQNFNNDFNNKQVSNEHDIDDNLLSLEESLKKLNNLRAQNLITNEEFFKLRNKILNDIHNKM